MKEKKKKAKYNKSVKYIFKRSTKASKREILTSPRLHGQQADLVVPANREKTCN